MPFSTEEKTRDISLKSSDGDAKSTTPQTLEGEVVERVDILSKEEEKRLVRKIDRK